jgi:transcriptional regulator of acetoin/glycerol metabolism
MDSRSADLRPELRRAREDFLSGRPAGRLVRAEIVTSWRRSALSGAQPEVPALPYSDKLDLDGMLYTAAQPVLHRLADRLDHTRAAILLADPDARIVARWVTDYGLRAMMDRTDSAPGFSLSEETCGTNGLGSIVEEGRGFSVVGYEHYAERFVDYACYGAPIRHPLTGRLQGVLTFMCQADHATPLMLPFVEETCEVIHDRMLAEISHRERYLLHAFVAAGRQTQRAVVAVDQKTIISSPVASRLLDGIEHATLWELAAKAIYGRAAAWETLAGAGDSALAVRARPVFDGDRVVGAVLELSAQRSVRPGEKASASPGSPRPEQQILRLLGGRSRAWLHAIWATARVAGSREPMLLVGEPGVGKLELARAVIEVSEGGRRPRVLDAALAQIDGLPGWLGRVRSAFDQSGTLVLTHLDSLTGPACQALAAVLDERGENAPRIIGTLTHGAGENPATGPHIERLTVHRIDLPPLRERSEDVPELVRRLLGRHDGERLRVTPAALQALVRSAWPGNVRQLDLLIRMIAAQRRAGLVELADLPPEVVESSRRSVTQLERLEMHAIMGALRKAGGNKRLAAADLGISRATLYRKLRSFHIDLNRTTF